jgi:hypothetical protein
MMMSTTTLTNKMIPGVNIYYAALHREINFGKLNLSGRAGISHQNVGEEGRIEFYKNLYPDSEGSRWFPVFGLSANYTVMFNNDWGAGALVEAGSEAPETEYLFMALQRPMNTPNWSGNPTLNQPVRGTVRGSINYQNIILDGFATQVWNYTNLTNKKVGDKPYTTYENVNAYMLGMNLKFEWDFIQLNASYTYAQNTTNNSPLSEIQPFSISTRLTSPVFYNSIVYLKHTYNDAQTRVDQSLNESTTPAWNRIDIGAMYNTGNILISIDLENLTNTLYYKHLSYLRDPFATGNKVFEPGTTVRLNVRVNSVFD